MYDPTSNAVQFALLSVGTFLGLSLAIFLLSNRSAKHKANVFLASILIGYLCYFFNGVLFRFGWLESFHYLIGFSLNTVFLYGPLAYFYVRACTQEGFTWKPIYFLHFIPCLIEILANIPFYLQDPADKIVFYEMLVFYGEIDRSSWLFAVKGIHALAYYFVSARIIFQYREHVFNQASSMDQAYHRWALIFIFLLAFPVGVQVVFFYGDFALRAIHVGMVFFFMFFLAVYIAALVKPQLFRIFPYQIPLSTPEESEREKYEGSNLQEDAKSKYLHTLKDYIQLKKPYLEPELTLSQLAEYTSIPSYHLSQVINEKLNVNFLDYINGCRVEEAKQKLTDPKLSHYTIISIAYESGFNSKSTFYSAFKKATGMTPSQYRKVHRSVA